MKGSLIDVRDLLPDLPLAMDMGGRPDSGINQAQIPPGDIALCVAITRAAECFNFYVCAIASVLAFPVVFFPYAQRPEGILYAFLILGLAYIAKPFGMLVSAAIRQRFGRQVSLTAAISALSMFTAGVAFLPGYAVLGPASMVLLAAFCIGQGMALGGLPDDLASSAVRDLPPAEQTRCALLGKMGMPAGFMLASGLFTCLMFNVSSEDFLDWGWRFPFYLALAVNMLALFARLRLVPDDSASRPGSQGLRPVHAGRMLRREEHDSPVSCMTGIMVWALLHFVILFSLSWITLYSTRPGNGVLLMQTVGGILAAAGIAASGKMADCFGKRAALVTIACLVALFSALVPLLLNGGESGRHIFILLGFSLAGMAYGQAPVASDSLVPVTHGRGHAVSASGLVLSAGAGFAPLVLLGSAVHAGLHYSSICMLAAVVGLLASLSLAHAPCDRDNLWRTILPNRNQHRSGSSK